MKVIITLLLFGLSIANSLAQTSQDSMLVIWHDNSLGTSDRAEAYYNYTSERIVFDKPDTAFIMMEELLYFIEKNSYPGHKLMRAKIYRTQGASYHMRGAYSKAIYFYQKSYAISKEIDFKHGMTGALNNIGYAYFAQGNMIDALDNYQRSLIFAEEIKYREGVMIATGNIGLIYASQHNYEQALKQYQLSLKIAEEIDNKHEIINWLNNIGLVYAEQHNHKNALEKYQDGLEIAENTNDRHQTATLFNNIGLIYADQSYFTEALDYYKLSLIIREEIGDKSGLASSLRNIGLIHNERGNYVAAVRECSESLNFSRYIGSLSQQKQACSCLYEAYKGSGNDSEALMYIEQILILEDSLNADETGKKLQHMEFQKQVLIDGIATAEKERLLNEVHEEEVRQKNRTRNVLLITGLFFVLLAVGFYARWRFVKKAKAVVEYEKGRSEDLLLNILPAEIAEELKAKGSADARDFNLVAILFTDFKGFTALSEKLSAQELVFEINVCFEAFDAIITKYNIEKIKTIGDAYMAAGGIPVFAKDSIKNTVLAALEMQAFISKRKKEMDRKGLTAFEMRAGIHAGPVVAGIVGVKKFQYDIWGDTVNTASRIESSGEVGKVNISNTIYEILKNETCFTFESRGKIEAKGKGEIEMYFVSMA